MEIKFKDDGPCLVSGPAQYITGDGQEITVEADKVVALCRCGGSSNKPFCDGTHTAEGFDSKIRVS